MANYKKAGFSLGTAVLLDAFITGGSVSLAGLGISGILQSLSTAGVNVFAGLCTHHLTKEKDGNSDPQLGRAFQQAVEHTLESVKDHFIKENKMDVPWWRDQSFKYGFDIPSFDDNYTLQNSLDRHFFQPLFRLLGDEKAIAEILTANQELNPSDFIKKLIEKEKIELPVFRKEHQEGLIKALVDGFKDRFRFHLIKNLLQDERARKAYQIQLLQTSITYLSRIDRKVDDLLDFAKSHKISLLEIDESINRRQTELTKEFHKLQSDFLHQFSLKLVMYRSKKYDIRDQFRFDSLYTTFQGRTKELDQLSDFLYTDSLFSFYAISGPGGAGKSRLANELCLKAESGRWICGFCDQDKNRSYNWDSFRPNGQTLIVFDYIKARKDEIADILNILSYHAEQREFQYKVRILLLERDFDEELRTRIFTSKTRTHYFTYLINEEEKPLKLKEMDEDARWRIIEQVVRELGDAEEIDTILSKKTSILLELDKQDPDKRPLFTFFSAVALREGASINGWNTHDNLKYHLQRLEDKVWSQVGIWQDESLRTPLRHLIWLAAICEFLTYEDMEMIKEYAPFKKLVERWDEESFWEQLGSLFRMENIEAKKGNFPGLKPDLLAEFYITSHLSAISENPMFHSHLRIIYSLAWNIRPKGAWWMSWLTISNFLYEPPSGLVHYIKWILTTLDIEDQYAGMLSFNLAILYEYLNRMEVAEKFYLKAIEKGNVHALNNLANLYQNLNRMNDAEKLYLQAIEKGDVNALNNLANLYQNLNRIEEAERFYIRAIEKGHPVSLNNLANLYQNLNRMEEAEKLYLKAIEKGFVDAVFNLANLYQNLNRMEEAEKLYLQAIEKGDVNALNNLAGLYQNLNRMEEAERFYIRAIETGHPVSLNNLANLYQNLNRMEEAEKLYLKAIEKGLVDAVFNLGNLYQKLNRTEEAERLYFKAIEKGNVHALNNLAGLYQNLNRMEEAERFYIKAIEKGDVAASFNLANLFQNLNRMEEAERFYIKAIEKGHVDALFNLAVFYQNLNRMEEAERYYLEAIEKGDVDAHNNLANLYQNLNRQEEAERLYLKAIGEGHVDALFNLAYLYQNLNRMEEAEWFYLKAIGEGHVAALNNLANLYRNLNRIEEAERFYLEAIEKGDVHALNNLAGLYQNLNRMEEAEKLYLKAVEKKNAAACFNLADLYRNLNRMEEAERYYLDAIEKGDVNACFNLALLYQNLNRLEKAERVYLEAIERGHINALNNLAGLYQNLNRIEEAERVYLEAIEKGHINALNNLALLYQNLNRMEEAESLYLKAIERGNVNAFKHLATYYCRKNQKMDVSWKLIELYFENTGEMNIQDRLTILLISAWANNTFFQENRFSIFNEIIRYQPELIPKYLMILYHDYSNFLINEFEEGILSDHLKENHYLEYLVTLHFFRPHDPKLGSIPSDIKPRFNELVTDITVKRAFYNETPSSTLEL